MTPLQTLDPVASPTLTPSAVVWVNGRQAIVATIDRDGQICTCEMHRSLEEEPSYLARIVHVIGDRDRVLILGPSSARLALEREYVTIFQRPDRLLDVEPAGAIDAESLIARLRTLAS